MTIYRRIPIVSLFLLRWLPEVLTAATVTLDSIEIYNTHEFLGLQPTIFFQCNGENRTTLPDVKEKGVLYRFKGEESWQPLSELHMKKCKRCGLYEEGTIMLHGIFDEWEFCASGFSSVDGKYIHFKEKEFNATFLCPECVPVGAPDDSSLQNEKTKNMALVVGITALVSVVLVLGVVALYKFWQRRKRQQEQARFMRLFEADNEIEDALGNGPLTHVI
ncbi:PREDICTED: uncharacterized protein LOC109153645 isoform X1 [Ipomoea nil]|uniref:uncharacterized protein LOC109153645 isoform X1 n=1 Tax=Ipomoea nil TaxID=35883 RepID=UPI00090173D5|nr:PREDICTED: uncharacterized protein LOC109153645 isoform X1 [Ipomoea nil]